MSDQQKKAVADYKAIRNTDLYGPALDGAAARSRSRGACVAASSAQPAEQRTQPEAHGDGHPDRRAAPDEQLRMERSLHAGA